MTPIGSVTQSSPLSQITAALSSNRLVVIALAALAFLALAFLAVRHCLPSRTRPSADIPPPPEVANNSSLPILPPIGSDTVLPPEDALPNGQIKAEAEQYGAASAIIAWSNQSKEGFRAGCTRNSLGFLASGKHMYYTASTLTDFIRNGADRGILPADETGSYSMDDPYDLIIGGDFNLNLVNETGQETPFPIEVSLNIEGTEHETLRQALNLLILSDQFDSIVGFTISAGTETFAVRFHRNGNVELFDPHGDSAQQAPCWIFAFNRDDAADKIARIILDRSLTLIREGVAGAGLILCPVAHQI